MLDRAIQFAVWLFFCSGCDARGDTPRNANAPTNGDGSVVVLDAATIIPTPPSEGQGGDGSGPPSVTQSGGSFGSGGSTSGGSSTSGSESGGAAPDGNGGAEASVPPSAGGAAGTLTRRTTPGGRSFLVDVPSSIDPAAPTPVLFVHHGYNGSADQVRQLTRFDTIANEKGFVAVFPEGIGSTWNAGVGVCGFGQFVTGLSDDFGFEQEMIQAVESSVHVDRARVFVTGFSICGYFANNVGCMRPDLVRGIAPHSGGGPPPGCVAGPMPALIVHGTADSLIWYQCGVQAREYWSGHNGCSSQVDIVPVKGGACEWHRGCQKGGQVVFCHMDGMSHGWAGIDGHDGGGSQYEDISRVIWDFFSQQ